MFTRKLNSTYISLQLQHFYATWINGTISRIIGYWLPMYRRQQRLDAKSIVVHRALLQAIATTGSIPSESDLQDLSYPKTFRWHQEQLEESDLLTQDEQGTITGLYPLSLTPTPYKVSLGSINLYAICAIDALAISPMFDKPASIQTRCHISQEPFCFSQKQLKIIDTQTNLPIYVGVRWQDPKSSARQSICNDMVYLLGEDNAKAWQAQDPKTSTLFTLEEAIEFSALLFTPLISNTKLSELPFRTPWFTKVSFVAMRILWSMLFSNASSDRCSSCTADGSTQVSSSRVSHFSSSSPKQDDSDLDKRNKNNQNSSYT